MKKILSVLLVVIMMLSFVGCGEGKVERDYNKAVALMEEGKYAEAIVEFEKLDGYKNSEKRITECENAIKYNDAVALMNEGKYTEAITAFKELGEYNDSLGKITECNTAILDKKYDDAVALMDEGKYIEAITAFETLDGHRDSATKILECKYNNAVALIDACEYIQAYDELIAINGFKDSDEKAKSIYENYKNIRLKTAKVGDYVLFGAYEQDNNTSNGKENVEWLVLEAKDGKIFAISKYALDCKQYNTNRTDITWENCSLRKWLNNDFINITFSTDEKTMIPTVEVFAEKPAGYYVSNPGNATQDQLFLLSPTELRKYFSGDAGKCKPTAYARDKGTKLNDDDISCWWWLRSVCNEGGERKRALIVVGDVLDEKGTIAYWPTSVADERIAVRPVMWIDLSKIQ